MNYDSISRQQKNQVNVALRSALPHMSRSTVDDTNMQAAFLKAAMAVLDETPLRGVEFHDIEAAMIQAKMPPPNANYPENARKAVEILTADERLALFDQLAQHYPDDALLFARDKGTLMDNILDAVEEAFKQSRLIDSALKRPIRVISTLIKEAENAQEAQQLAQYAITQFDKLIPNITAAVGQMKREGTTPEEVISKLSFTLMNAYLDKVASLAEDQAKGLNKDRSR